MTNPVFPQRRILIVEDNYDLWYILRQAIHQVNPSLETHHVNSKHDALTYLQLTSPKHAPDLILQDLHIPTQEEGFALLKNLKDPACSIQKIPLIMLSSSANPVLTEQAYMLGCNSFIQKPTSFPDWLKVLRNIQAYWWNIATLPTNL